MLTTEAEAEINALPADIRARFLHSAELLQSFGPQHVREPHVKPLGQKLWEMRMTGKDGIARAIYFAAERRQQNRSHGRLSRKRRKRRNGKSHSRCCG
jgi:phage-related protein